MKAENDNALDAVDEYYPVVKTTGISNSTDSKGEIASIEYPSTDGMRLLYPQKGINRRIMRLLNGSVITDKVIK